MARHEHRATLGAEAGAAARAPRGCPPGRDRSPVRRGSSSAGSLSNAAASPSRCRMPSEYLRDLSSAAFVEPDDCRAPRRRGGGRCGRCAPSSRRFSRPVIVGNSAGDSTIAPTRGDHLRRARREPACPSSADRPARRAHEPEHAADRRRLARTVRAEEPEHAALGNREVEAVDRGRRRPPRRRYSLRSPSISITFVMRYRSPRRRLLRILTDESPTRNRLASFS